MSDWNTAELRNTMWCVLLPVACTLAAVPVLEMGVHDDWSYAYTARELAFTGHFRYNGQAGMVLGAQAWWGALIIRLFGFSFTALRLSTMLFAAGCGALLYRIARRAGLQPALAVFASLAVVLSPLFTPLSASFMTDIPALFFLLCFTYAGQRALESAGRIECALWTVLLTLAGVVGGSIRQIVWAAPLLGIPSIAWARRRDGRLLLVAAGLWTAAGASAVVTLRWHGSQPYALPMDLLPLGLFLYRMAAQIPALAILWALTLMLLMTPALAAYSVRWPVAPRSAAWFAGLLVCGVLALVAALWLGAPAPWMANMLTAYGLWPRDAIGPRPVVLPGGPRVAVTVLTMAAACVCIAVTTHAWSDLRAAWRRLPPRLPWFLSLLGPYCCCYALMVAGTTHPVFDRYLLPLLPALLIPMLWNYQEVAQPRVPAVCWVLLVIFAVYGVATTHDYLAAARARLAAASAVVEAGVPRQQITAGMEYDGWTQIEQLGHLNHPGIRVPAGAYRPPTKHDYPVSYWFWDYTPAVEPRYFIVHGRQPGLVDSSFPPVTYTAWLPPARRQVFIQSVPREGQAP